MTDAVPARRRQLTLFVPDASALAIEAVRARLDPIQHRLIRAHVTLCREDELARWSADALRHRLAESKAVPLTLTFGPATSFVGHGVLLPCIDGEPGFHALRARLLGDMAVRRPEPHLTLAHPRNPRSPQNAPAASTGLPVPLLITFSTVRLIEQTGHEPWQVLDTYTLCGFY